MLALLPVILAPSMLAGRSVQLPGRPFVVQRLRRTPPRLEVEWSKEGDRGHAHLSAYLAEGELIIYQSGTWMVDNIEVGDGTPAVWRLAQVDTIQVNWTGTGEHGVVRGFAARWDPATGEIVCDEEDDEQVDVGPEQLVARLLYGDPLPERAAEMLAESSIYGSG